MSTSNERVFIDGIKAVMFEPGLVIAPVDNDRTLRLQNLEEALLRNAKRGNPGTVSDISHSVTTFEICTLVQAILEKPKFADTRIEAMVRSIVMDGIYKEAMRLAELRGDLQ